MKSIIKIYVIILLGVLVGPVVRSSELDIIQVPNVDLAVAQSHASFSLSHFERLTRGAYWRDFEAAKRPSQEYFFSKVRHLYGLDTQEKVRNFLTSQRAILLVNFWSNPSLDLLALFIMSFLELKKNSAGLFLNNPNLVRIKALILEARNYYVTSLLTPDDSSRVFASQEMQLKFDIFWRSFNVRAYGHVEGNPHPIYSHLPQDQKDRLDSYYSLIYGLFAEQILLVLDGLDQKFTLSQSFTLPSGLLSPLVKILARDRFSMPSPGGAFTADEAACFNAILFAVADMNYAFYKEEYPGMNDYEKTEVARIGQLRRDFAETLRDRVEGLAQDSDPSSALG